MHSVCFRLNELPDLSLAKYASLDGQGVDAVLAKHVAFLRQFAAKPNLSLHLLYAYNPSSHEGSRLEVYVVAVGSPESLRNVPQLIQSSALSPYFSLEQLGPPAAGAITAAMEGAGPLVERFGRFAIAGVLTKSAAFVTPKPPHPDAPNGYFTIPEFEPQSDSRLYSMAKVMEALNEPVLYRVDLYPSQRSTSLRGSLPLDFLRRRQDDAPLARDYTAEGISKGYQGLLDRFDGSPHFNANIFAFASSVETARAVLDSAAAEAVKKGGMTATFFAGDFSAAAYLDAGQAVPDRSIDGSFVGMPYVDRAERPGYFFVPERAAKYAHFDLTTLFTLEDAAAFYKLPALFDGEAVQRRKETSPDAVSPDHGIFLGRDDHNYEVYLPSELLPKHAFISGMPGSGKTNLMLHLVSTLKLVHKVPFLVLEPAKREYRALLNQPGMEEVYLFSPAAQMRFPLRINPFQMPVGISVAEHIARLCRVFEGAFPLEGALPFLLDRAIETVYRDNGWTPKHVRTGSEEWPWPTLSQLYQQLESELEKSDYSGEVRGNLKSALQTRIGGLLRREQGEIFDVPDSTIDASQWLHTSAIIELAGLGRAQANFLTLLLCVLIREALAASPVFDDGPVRHVLFIEEAHNLIGPSAEEVSGEHADPKQAATAFIRDMLAEVRALRQGIVIADQLPTAMAPEVIKNTGFKVGLRITSGDDRQLLGSTMGANALQMEQMAAFAPGTGLISYEGLLRAFTFTAKQWRGPDGEDCIADPQARREAQTPLADVDLFTKVCGSAWYRHARERSVIIDLNTTHHAIKSLFERTADVRRALAQRRLAIAELEALLRTGEGDQTDSEIASRISEQEQLGATATEQVARALSRLGHAEVGGVVVQLNELLDSLDDKRRHWALLGLGTLAEPKRLTYDPQSVDFEQWAANQYLTLKRIVLKTKLDLIRNSYGLGLLGDPATHSQTLQTWTTLVREFTDRHGLPDATGDAR
jgi:hypothetical protein